MNYQKFVLVGNASTDAQVRKSKVGDITFASFGVGVSNSKDRTSFFPVVVFGQLGEAIAKQVTKGRQVLVEGRIEVSGGRFNIVADRVVLGVLPQAAKQPEKAKESR
ncbi:MAG TPA: single-stranded DNA-binding protein [Anaerolineaceae bacterium]